MISTATPTPGAYHEVAEPKPTELGLAFRRIQTAQRRRAAPSHDARIAALESLERALVGRKNAIAKAIAADFGHRSKHETFISDVYAVVSAIHHTKAHLREWMDLEERKAGWIFRPSTCCVVKQPLGVVGIISPWNYPVQLALSPLVAAIGAGNSALIKPSELVPATAEQIRDLVSEVFADEVVAVVTGAADVGEAFAQLPFDHLVFTGSTRVGKLVMRAASAHLVPVTLELGGKSPAIVGQGVRIPTAASRIMAGKTFNAGQTCVAPDYALVPAAAREAFVDGCRRAVEKAYGTIATNPDYTSIVSDAHYARLRACIADAVDRGGQAIELLPPGESGEALARARKIAPTLVLNPSAEMICMQDEIFGPILPVLTYTSFSEAIALVNGQPRPLALYFFGHDDQELQRVVAETTSGGVAINETMLHVLQDDLPFGGVGPSGMGHYHGREGFETLSKKKPIYIQSRVSTTGLLRPPYGRWADRILSFLIGKESAARLAR